MPPPHADGLPTFLLSLMAPGTIARRPAVTGRPNICGDLRNMDRCPYIASFAMQTTVGGTMGFDIAFEKVLASLPLATYRAGDTIIAAGSKSGRLLILKQGAILVVKEAVEIARVSEPGAVFGELSALLDQPHSADVRALEQSQFYVADALLPAKDPAVLLHVARILARRIVEANKNLVELKSQFGRSPSAASKLLERIQEILSVGGASFET
jgi:CRP/FNR family transcriptional regulator, cyclic AMP receptor protein